MGIRGTSLAMAASGGTTNIGLSSGAIEVRNGQTSLHLGPGEMLAGVRREGSLQDKVQPFPYQIHLTAPPSINLAQEASLRLRLRLTSNDGSPLPQGQVYLHANVGDLQKPQAVLFDERGEAACEVIFPSQQTDQTELVLQAVMEDQWNVAAGQAIVALSGTLKQDEVKGLRSFGEE